MIQVCGEASNYICYVTVRRPVVFSGVGVNAVRDESLAVKAGVLITVETKVSCSTEIENIFGETGIFFLLFSMCDLCVRFLLK